MSVIGDIFKSQSQEKFKALQNLYTDKNLDFITDLTEKEILAFSFMNFVENYCNTNWFNETKTDKSTQVNFSYLIKLIFKRKVSRNRLGRTEATDVLKANAMIDEERQTKRGLGRFLF